MRKDQEISDPASCLNQAEPDEPLFTLRAHDPLAPFVVQAWAGMYRHAKETKGEWGPDQIAKWNDAGRCAYEMQRWYERNVLHYEPVELSRLTHHIEKPGNE